MRLILTICATGFMALGTVAPAQTPFSPDVSVPSTTRVVPGEKPGTVHTQHLEFTGQWSHGGSAAPQLLFGPNALIEPPGYHPSDISAAYDIPQRGKNAIAVVEAYHLTTSLNDFNVFSNQYALPQEPSTTPTASSNKVFQVVYATGSQPTYDENWGGEAALDIEWTHAMAPGAKIYLVECKSDSFDDIVAGIDKAGKLPGVREVCMSFGAIDFPGETSYDSAFSIPNIVYFAAAGDDPGYACYPATSPNVIGVGGTSLEASIGEEVAWSGSGGGISKYEPMPSYQASVENAGPTSARFSPDMAAVADPSTGLSVYDSAPDPWRATGWLVFGGTSAACAVVTGITNSRSLLADSTGEELVRQYGSLPGGYYSYIFRDITSGTNGTYSAGPGYDLITGLGAPVGLYPTISDVEQDPISVTPYPSSTIVLSGGLASIQSVDFDFYTIESAPNTAGTAQEGGIETTYSPNYPSPFFNAGTSSFYILVTAQASQTIPVNVYVFNFKSSKWDFISQVSVNGVWESSFTPDINAGPYMGPDNQVEVRCIGVLSQKSGLPPPFVIGFDNVMLLSDSTNS